MYNNIKMHKSKINKCSVLDLYVLSDFDIWITYPIVNSHTGAHNGMTTYEKHDHALWLANIAIYYCTTQYGY